MHIDNDLNACVRLPIPGMPAMSALVDMVTLAVKALKRKPSMVTVVTDGPAIEIPAPAYRDGNMES